MRKFGTFLGILSACVFLLSACSNTATSSSGAVTSGSGAQESNSSAETSNPDPLVKTSSKSVLENIKLGEKLEGTTYMFSAQGGVNTYYIHGRYVITNSGVVTQIRDELEIEDVKTPLREILTKDKDFDLSKAEVTFYGSDGKPCTGSLDEPLSSVITDCVAEYVVWLDEAKTYGEVQSYLFTYGYVPTKVTGYYDKNAVTESSGESETSDTESKTESETSESETESESESEDNTTKTE